MRSLIAIFLFPGLMSVAACATNTARIPPLSRIAHIHLTAGQGWMLSILPDGSGAIGYGSNAFDFASIPAATFDFEHVYRSLVAVVNPDGNMREWFTVAFHEKGKTVAYSLHTRDADLVPGLFKTAKDKCQPLDKVRMDERWKRSPPSLDW